MYIGFMLQGYFGIWQDVSVYYLDLCTLGKYHIIIKYVGYRTLVYYLPDMELKG